MLRAVFKKSNIQSCDLLKTSEAKTLLGEKTRQSNTCRGAIRFLTMDIQAIYRRHFTFGELPLGDCGLYLDFYGSMLRRFPLSDWANWSNAKNR